MTKGAIINSQYYVYLLKQAREAVVQKRHRRLVRGVLFLQHNAAVHTVRVAKDALEATTSPILFPNLKIELRRQRFSVESELKATVENHFKENSGEKFQ